MKLWQSVALLVVLATLSFVGIVQVPADGDPPMFSEQPRYILGVRGDARFDEAWDRDLVHDALTQAGFEIIFEDDWNVHARRGGDGPLVKVLPMGEGVLLHVIHELDEAAPYDDENDPDWRNLESMFMAVVRDLERGTGWAHTDLEVRPLVTDA